MHGLNQVDVAAAIGVSQGALVNYEKRLREPPAAVIVAFLRAYSVNPAWLLLGEGSRDQASADDIFVRSIDIAWNYLSGNGEGLDKVTLIKLSGTLFQYLMEHGEISSAMSEKLLSLSSL